MIEVVSGARVWERLEPHLSGGERRSAAVAYIGAQANDWLRLKTDDVLIFDGDDTTIKAGLINLDVIGKLMQAGVRLYSCPGLHAKVMVIESIKPRAIVGSANASVNSVERKAEAVVVTDDAAAVTQVAAAITAWHLGQTPLSSKWLKRVRTLPQAKRSSATVFTQPELPVPQDPNKPMWLAVYERVDAGWESEVEAAISSAIQDTGLVVDAFPLQRRPQTYNAVKTGDHMLFLTWSNLGGAPRANTRVEEPWTVLGKLDRGQSGDIIVGTRPRPGHSRWDEVSSILGTLELVGPPTSITSRARRAALLKLFAN